jgi:hypothetical protein
MIISASYKTDIPTFYGEWFINRLRAGYCKVVNPYGRKIFRVDLSPEGVDGFVFWTKNVGPFLTYLAEVHRKGFPFFIQHTINSYPRELESRVIDYSQTIEHMKRISGEYGTERLIWRYDPIIFSSLTPVDWHRRNFEALATALDGITNEVVISFAQLYKKTERNMDVAAKELGFSWNEHKVEATVLENGRLLAAELAQIAVSHGMGLKVCSQKAFLIPGVVEEARCIDADRLERIAGYSFKEKSWQKGNRKECGCFASKDIGEYDTCPHGCVYCYAVHHRNVALEHYKAHNPQNEFLFPSSMYIAEEDAGEKTIQIISTVRPRKANHINSPQTRQKGGGSEIEQKRLF